MIDCMVLGDSIAVGTHQQRPECVAYAKSGINSSQWNWQNLDRDITANTVIISLGSNDHRGVYTHKELTRLREKVKGARVFWILPAGNNPAGGVDIRYIQQVVREVAGQHGDTVLPITRLQADGVHPTGLGYRELADQTR